MAPPRSGAGEPVSAAPAPGTEPPQHERDAKRHRPSPRPAAASAGARVLSLAVKAAVMAAALALFILFAAAAAILLLHLVVAAHAFRHHRRSRYRVPSLDPSPLAGSHLRAGLTPAQLRLLPCFALDSTRGDDGDASSAPHLCAVCIEAGRAGERWRALPACGHAFHAACVDRWLAKSPACPVCRATVVVTVR